MDPSDKREGTYKIWESKDKIAMQSTGTVEDAQDDLKWYEQRYGTPYKTEFCPPKEIVDDAAGGRVRVRQYSPRGLVSDQTIRRPRGDEPTELNVDPSLLRRIETTRRQMAAMRGAWRGKTAAGKTFDFTFAAEKLTFGAGRRTNGKGVVIVPAHGEIFSNPRNFDLSPGKTVKRYDFIFRQKTADAGTVTVRLNGKEETFKVKKQ